MRKKVYLVIVTLFVFISAMGWDMEIGHSAANLPQKVRIGIYFEKTAPSMVEIYSDMGFEIGYEQNDQFTYLSRQASIKKLIIRKDAYFIDTGTSFVEYSPNNPNIPMGNKYGPYHLELEENYANYDMAMQKAQSLNVMGLKAFPAFTRGAFKVWVGLYTSEQDAENVSAQLKAISNCDNTLISPNSKSVLVFEPGIDIPKLAFDNSSLYLTIKPIESKDIDPVITINNRKYRGAVEIKRFSDSDMTVINLVDIEEYLYGVLPREMGGSWPLEALKAQAVAARTYTALHWNKYSKYGFNLCNTTKSQVYGGYSSENINCTQAVKETKGKLLTYNGKPAYIYYFSTSGGKTEDIRNVWGGSEIPYLKGVEDPFEPTHKSDRGIWNIQISGEDIGKLLQAQNYDLGNILSVKPIEYSDAGRVIKLKVIGTKGEKVFEKDKTRTIFGANFMNSQYYTVKTDSDIYIRGKYSKDPVEGSGSSLKVLTGSGIKTFNPSIERFYAKGDNTKKSYAIIPKIYTFDGRGWGHGVGLSQWGARGMAEAGYSYDQILLHYFPGTLVGY